MSKVVAKLIGANGNIFNLMAIASLAIKEAGDVDKSEEMSNRVFNTKSYDEAISIILEYVDPIEVNEPEVGGFKI